MFSHHLLYDLGLERQRDLLTDGQHGRSRSLEKAEDRESPAAALPSSASPVPRNVFYQRRRAAVPAAWVRHGG